MLPSSRMGGTGGLKKVAYGINGAVPKDGGSSTHAEELALQKAIANPRIKKHKTYDLFVVRFSKAGILGNSRPCRHCILRMMLSDIKIHTVYYSTETGEIREEKLTSMLSSEMTYVSTGNRTRTWTKAKRGTIIRRDTTSSTITSTSPRGGRRRVKKSGRRSLSPATV